jgi:hypothetical protein
VISVWISFPNAKRISFYCSENKWRFRSETFWDFERNQMEIEHFFVCPHCWEEISMLLDLSVEEQQYLEDCEVCCNPIAISYKAQDSELRSFAAESVDR